MSIVRVGVFLGRFLRIVFGSGFVCRCLGGGCRRSLGFVFLLVVFVIFLVDLFFFVYDLA